METNKNNHELSKLQMQDLEILLWLHNLCEKNSLSYYLVAGSMLGAVRHHGFIPWDDDIDVAMPRKDYDRFLMLSKRISSDKYYVETPREKNHVMIVTNIISKEGGYALNNAEKALHMGAWIDVMVVDGVPNPGLRRTIHWYHYLLLRALYQISHFDEIVDQRRERPFIEKMVIKIAKYTHLQKWLDSTKINKRIESLLRKQSVEDSEYVATYCGIYRKKEIVPKDWYGKGKEYDFEGYKIYGLDDADKYLTQLYGDYMTPPKDTSVSKHNVTEEPTK